MSPTHMLADTSVWLSIAEKDNLRPVLDHIDQLTANGKLQLVVPPIVRDEFVRNSEVISKRAADQYRAYTKHARALAPLLSDPDGVALSKLVDMAGQEIPKKTHVVAHALHRIRRILEDDRYAVAPATDADLRYVVTRALEKRAPFHRNRNSVADALILRAFERVSFDSGENVTCVFVTENTSDFSAPNDPKNHHPDFAETFASINAVYSINVAAVLDAISPVVELARVAAAYSDELATSDMECPVGGYHNVEREWATYLRGGAGGLKLHYRCRKCGALLETDEYFD